MTHHYIFRIRTQERDDIGTWHTHVWLDECVAAGLDEAREVMRERHSEWARMCLVHTQLCVDIDDDVALGKRDAKRSKRGA